MKQGASATREDVDEYVELIVAVVHVTVVYVAVLNAAGSWIRL